MATDKQIALRFMNQSSIMRRAAESLRDGLQRHIDAGEKPKIMRTTFRVTDQMPGPDFDIVKATENHIAFVRDLPIDAAALSDGELLLAELHDAQAALEFKTILAVTVELLPAIPVVEIDRPAERAEHLATVAALVKRFDQPAATL